jgi:hypothetical protein
LLPLLRQKKKLLVTSLPLLRQSKKCFGYIVTNTGGASATEAATTEAAATGTAAKGGAVMAAEAI